MEVPQVFLTRFGVAVDKRHLISAQANAQFAQYFNSLQHTYMPRIGQPKRILAYKPAKLQPNGREVAIFPRSAISQFARLGFAIRETLPAIIPIARDSRGLDFLYEDQVRIVRTICSAQFSGTNGSACLDLRAGYGKTFIAAGIIAQLAVRTLYVVPTRELAHQVEKDLRATIGAQGITITYAASSAQFTSAADAAPAVSANAGANVVIVIINTLLRAESVPKFSLTIFDEVHMYCSAKRAEVFWRTQTPFMFGMSATMGERRDGFDCIIAHHLSPIMDAAKIDGFVYGDFEFKCIVRAVRYNGPDEFTQNLRHEATDHVFAHYMYEQFARDTARNNLIVARAHALVAEGHNVFIFAEERAHVELLATHFGTSATVFYGGISNEERLVALSGTSRIILATYSYSGTGVSIVRMTAIILATPRYSGMKQIIGRILRRGSDARIPRIIVDIIDQKTCLAYQFRLRKNAYRFYGASIEKETVAP